MAVITIYASIMLLLYFLRSGSVIVNISLPFNLASGYMFIAASILNDVEGGLCWRVAAFSCHFLVLLYTILMHVRHALFE